MRRGLTLVELLFAVAIIAILAAILFPVPCRPREAARKTSCLSNMKQIGQALQLYAHDFDDRLPPHAYLIGNRSVLLPSLLKPYVRNDRLWACPSARQGERAEAYAGRSDDPKVDYGYNWSALTADGRGVSLYRAVSPADTVAFVEADTYLATPEPLVPALGGSAPVYRHKEMVNVAWLDGHIKSGKSGKLEATASQEGGKPLSSGIDRFLYWNLR